MLRRKFVKIPLIVLAVLIGALALAAGGVYATTNYRLRRLHSIEVRPVAVPTDAATIARGKHIVTTRSCADCHGADFGGAKVVDDPAAGQLYGPNITRGQGGLPANYTDLDYVRAIRHGLAQDGRALIMMPSAEYTTLSDEDLGAIIAYLKTVPAVDRERGPLKPGPVIRALMVAGQVQLSAEEIDHAAHRPASVPPSPTAEYGKYLAAGCTGCHGPNLSGGKIPGAPPDWPSTANLTSHASSRLNAWTEDQFIATLRTLKRPDGSALHPLMPAAIGQMTDEELKAIWAYLRTLPATETGAR
jgi:mono/diheme cytochrome c family protein